MQGENKHLRSLLSENDTLRQSLGDSHGAMDSQKRLIQDQKGMIERQGKI